PDRRAAAPTSLDSRRIPSARCSSLTDLKLQRKLKRLEDNTGRCRGPTTSFACRFRDGPFDAYETSGGFHVQTARPQLRDLARRVRRRPPPGTEGPTRRGG